MENDSERKLKELETIGIVALTSEGQVTILKSVGATEDFIVTCLVAHRLAHKLGKASKPTMSVDDLIGAGGLAQRLARQTIYNSTSSLAKGKIIQKRGNEFYVDERTELQFFASKVPQLSKRG